MRIERRNGVIKEGASILSSIGGGLTLSFVSRSWAQTEVTRRRALPALTSRERTDSTWSARREPNCCLRTRYCAAAAAAAASSAAAAAAHGS